MVAIRKKYKVFENTVKYKTKLAYKIVEVLNSYRYNSEGIFEEIKICVKK